MLGAYLWQASADNFDGNDSEATTLIAAGQVWPVQNIRKFIEIAMQGTLVYLRVISHQSLADPDSRMGRDDMAHYGGS